MELYQQNDSGIMMSNATTPGKSLSKTANNNNNNNNNSKQLTSQLSSNSLNNGANSAGAVLGNLKPPKTPARMYSRDRSNHSMSMVYSANSRNNNNLNDSLSNNNNNNNNQHLSRRNSSSNNNNNLSVLDSDAQSLPQGTFAIKAGPQTIMSQWVITLDDDDDDEEDDEEDEDEDDRDEENADNIVAVVDDLNNHPHLYTPNLYVNSSGNHQSIALSDPEEKWEDALASRMELLSTGSNQRQSSIKSPGSSKQPVKQSVNSLANPKYLQHSMSDNLLNYEHSPKHFNNSEAANKQPPVINTSLHSPPQKKSSTPNSSSSLPSPPPPPPSSQPPHQTINNSLDPFQTLLNQILADSGSVSNKTKANNDSKGSMSNLNENNNSNSSLYDKQHKFQNLPSNPDTAELTKIKYLKNNYNIQYYPSDFINFTQQAADSISPNSANSKNDSQGWQGKSKPPSSDFIVANTCNVQSPGSNKSTNSNGKQLLLAAKSSSYTASPVAVPASNSSTASTSSTSSSSSKFLSHQLANQTAADELSPPPPFLLKNNSSTNIRNSLKLAKLNSNFNATSMLVNSPSASSSSNTNNNNNEQRYADSFQQQLADLQSNLKSVKSLTNLYESKQLSISPPNTSPTASSSGNQGKSSNNAGNAGAQQNLLNATVDFGSIFNKYNELTTANLNQQQQANPQQQCLLSSSSSSTSSSSSANQHIQIDYNNNNFNSRSLGAFQTPGYNNFADKAAKHAATANKIDGSETNLSVKTAVNNCLIFL